MKIRLRTWAVPIGLLLVALGVRLLYLEQAQSDPLYSVISSIRDSLYYHRHGAAIAGVDPALDPVPHLPYFLGPLYSYFIGLVYALFHADPELVRAAQAMLGAASCVLVWAIGRELFGARAGLVAALLLCFYDLQIYYTKVLLPTTLVLFLNLLFLFVLTVGGGRPSVCRWLLAGLVAGLATAAKTNALLLVPATLVVVWLVPQEFERGTRLRVSAALLVGAALAIAPFTARNWVQSGHFVLVNTTGGLNLWKGNGPAANGTHVFSLPVGALSGEDEDFDPRERATNVNDYLNGTAKLERVVAESSYFTGRTLEYMAQHPARALGLLAKKLALFLNAVELGIRDRFYFERRYSLLLQLPLPSFGFIAPLGLAGLLFAWRRRPRAALLYAVFAVQVVSFVTVFVLARYRMVAVACLCMFAGWLLVEWFDALRAARARALLPSLAAVAVAAVCVHLPFEGFGRERGFGLAYLELGQRHEDHGDHRAAIEAFEQARLVHWEDDESLGLLIARLKLAESWLALGDTERARSLLKDLQRELQAGASAPPDLARRVDRALRKLEF